MKTEFKCTQITQHADGRTTLYMESIERTQIEGSNDPAGWISMSIGKDQPHNYEVGKTYLLEITKGE